jgi:hypothetical protein
MLRTYLCLYLTFCGIVCFSQPAINPQLQSSIWKSKWIAPSNTSLTTYGVYHFRKNFSLDKKPKDFTINISADNRYKLFVNGTYAGIGPQRSDLGHWRFETINIAPYLKAGKNVIAVQVWNHGEFLPWPQLSKQTGLVVQGNAEASNLVNTNSSWKVVQNQAIKPSSLTKNVVGAFDNFNAALNPWGWERPDFNNAGWGNAIETENAVPFAAADTNSRKLLPRNIPFLEEKEQRFSSIRRSDGIKVDNDFLKSDKSFTLKPNTTATLLLDQGILTIAYPKLIVSGGKGCKITLTYVEALTDSKGQKGNRNVIEGKAARGDFDIFTLDGGKNRELSTLWYRTFRYVEMKIENSNEALTIHKFTSKFSAYPFRENGKFKSDNPELAKIWETGWRTARLCAHETYMDCPYYEQLQYVGDTRIQALISLYVSGDDRLMRNAISQFNDSRTEDGLTRSRYPSSRKQVITPFSLFWICMVDDYRMHRPDSAFVKSFLPGIRGVLAWHQNNLQQNNLLSKLPFWSFVDWTKEWMPKGGVPSGATEGGNSTILSLQYAYTLKKASAIFKDFGLDKEAAQYQETADKINAAAYDLCWDKSKGMLADTPEKKAFSQHANVMAVLADAIPKADEQALLKRILVDTSITQCTIYYRFYLNEAFKKAGLGDMYTQMLQPWENMLNVGLTTFAEMPEPTRSDCHAWSSSPNYDLLATVCGIEPAASGFKRVKIEPRLGLLTRVEGEVPHPNGNIKVSMRKTATGISAEIKLPKGLEGDFVFDGKSVPLHFGFQKVEI